MACNKKMCAVDFRKRAQIQVGTETDDLHGGRVITWANAFIIRCKIKENPGGEKVASDVLWSKAPVVFTCKFNSQNQVINSKDYRILYKNKLHEIRYVRNLDEANKYLEIGTEFGVAI